MCTVTVLPRAVLSSVPPRRGMPLRLRVACNRDELASRPPALPPTLTRLGPRDAIMPVDPDSGGTWIGVNDAGLVCALLNVYDGRASIPSPISRGTIIPFLLGCGDLESVLARVAELPAGRYQPFRLLAIDGREFVECWNYGPTIDHCRLPLLEPLMRTSCGLGDCVATGPRSALFERFMHRATEPIAAQDLFHLHQWPGREEVSVRMRRADARTVSHTVVEIDDAVVRVVYRSADVPDGVSVSIAA